MRLNKADYSFSFVVGFACFIAIFSFAVWCETPDWIEPFAEHVYASWKTGEPMPQISVAHPEATQQEAYLVQRAFVERVMESDTIGGYKAAGVGSAAADHPLVAVMPASGILSAAHAVRVDLKDDSNRYVETEIGYVFAKSITAPLADMAMLRDCVKAVVSIVELPGGAVEQKQSVTENDIIVWNINAKAMIVGAEHNPDSLDPDAVAVTLKRDEETVNTAKGDMAAGGQWNTLLKTVNHLLTQGYVIQSGHIITNGALGKILKAEPGNYHANFGILGVIEFVVQ